MDRSDDAGAACTRGARIWAANTLGLDYREEARKLGPPPVPMVDVHSHIMGGRASEVYADARAAFGIDLTYTMTPIEIAEPVRDALGDTVRFIAVPSWMAQDKSHAARQGWLDAIERFHGDFGSRMLKFWVSPRSREFASDGGADIVGLESEWKIKAAELGQKLGMMYMVHVADPDTWFQTKYTDSALYGTKEEQYAPLERMLNRFEGPWIAAHMGGWPEDLDFLDGLLERHPNLSLDTSACKWVVRELSTHEPTRVRAFFQRWTGRLLFGSDIVTMDDHLTPTEDTGPTSVKSNQADNPEDAFELYASRYWALRTLFESDYDGPSPIADPDLPMVEPDKYGEMSSPPMRGASLSDDTLKTLYRGAWQSGVAAWF